MRLQQWVATSFTDEAMLQSVANATFLGQTLPSPSEWPRTWNYYGMRIGADYTGAAARGSAEFIVGNILRDDPRHVKYKDDPLTHYGTKLVGCSSANSMQLINWGTVQRGLAWHRIGHAFLDSVVVRRSSRCGNGARLPALDRLAGVWASAYSSSDWYPEQEQTLSAVATRAGTSYAVTLGGSFYNEFSEEITGGLMRILGHRKGGN